VTFLLLDECVAKCCAKGATSYTPQRSVAVECLGPSAGDFAIYQFVRASSSILVTLNGRDFAALSVRYEPIPVIVLPSVPPRKQHAYLSWVLPLARYTFGSRGSRFVEVSASGKAISYRVTYGLNWDTRFPVTTENTEATIH